MARKFVPEFETRTRRTRAGFVPGYDEPEVELWSVWCRSTDGEERRATTQDMRRAGFVQRKKRR